MNMSSIARRYAKALFDLGVEMGLFEELGRELALARASLEANPDLAESLRSPIFSRQEKLALAETLVKALGLSSVAGNALRVMAERGRLAELPEIERSYSGLADEHAGRLRTHVVSAITLDAETLRRIGQALSRTTERNVIIEHSVEPSIMGGLIAKVDSRTFDGSVKNQIDHLKNQLKV